MPTDRGSSVGDLALSVAEVGADYGLSLPTVHKAVVGYAEKVLVEPAPVTVLGIDETRRGRPRWEQDPDTGKWRLVDRWQTGFVDLGGTQGLLGQCLGRKASEVSAWLEARTAAFRAAVTQVAIDPTAAYAAAIRRSLPDAVRLVMARKNHLLPCVKATGWTTTKAGRKKRIYDKPRTPYQRLIDAGVLDEKTRARLEREHADLNPAKITRRIHKTQQQLIQLAAARTRGTRPAA